ncbi:tRNA glutamyl-Q(34) synthetase GluQRS [Cohnella hashimotonis]|uniref:Glutamyl-Q tRNA(Asp) synthetase n=1 Tax=Cohnella hashimotonis TaxID=2826895 RepID=A0ABT6TIQ1_9BACL|nr:tRNA glutamyl-Q(34) synthetase GluQRS [Cohnella hashimotonis]MDI4645732.1 tRNA glutamyl-Q(34) synthetase GluQRS [Cohnella hashimotonis]
MTSSGQAVRGRFAPTPSGRLHLGNAMTALLAWLQIRSAGGEMVLRLEDLDRQRCRPELAKLLQGELRWLGLDWDEGPDVGGPHAPYEQSGRTARYERVLDELQRQGRLYPCYCSRADLQAAASAPHGLDAEGPAYPGTCRQLTAAERAERALRKTPSLRFAMDEEATYRFEDGIAGETAFAGASSGDFVVRRADGIVAYQLAVVADDIEMEITDVLRGWDLLDSTPRQLALYAALGATPPRFAHSPLVLGADGSRLSKRHGAVSLSELREQYDVRAERIVGFLAWLAGLHDRIEELKPVELLATFDLSAVRRQAVTLPDRWMELLSGGDTGTTF